MSKDFSLEVALPSGKVRRIKELKNRDYLSVVKFCHNNDYYGLSECFNYHFLDDDLDIIDKFYLLIYIRMLFVDSSLTFNSIESHNMSISLDTILAKLDNISFTDYSKTIEKNDILLSLGLPTAIYFRDINDLYNSVIKSVTFKGTRFNFKDLTASERESILDKLPSSLFDGIQIYLNNLSSSAFDMTVIEGNKKHNINQLKLNLISNGVMEFIAAIFKIDLDSYYELIYAFYNTVLQGSTIFEDISPVEAKLLLKIHNRHINKQNEELKKQQK